MPTERGKHLLPYVQSLRPAIGDDISESDEDEEDEEDDDDELEDDDDSVKVVSSAEGNS